MSEIKIKGPDGKVDTITGTYDEKTRTATSTFGGKTIHASQHDRVEVSSCFIATEVYGGANEPEVEILRDFRDKVILSKGLFGRYFVDSYYKVGPYMAATIRKLPWLKPIVRRELDKITKKCKNKLAGMQ